MDESNFNEHSTNDPERLMRDIRRSGRLVGAVGKHKATKKGLQVECSTEEKKEKSSSVSDFDCNICFELAKEPVVTSCGHLFCWPCLYQWLHVHCYHKECPVCKGKVDESNIVPIYGRGSSEACLEKGSEGDGDLALKIPPRPHGNRVESLRQQLQSTLFRRSEAFIEEHLQELFTDLPERIRSLQREERNSQTLQRNNPSSPLITAPTSLTQDGMVSRRQISLQDSAARLPAIIAELRSLARRRNQLEVITISDDGHDPDPAPSQASTSSTMAMIQGDIAASDASLAPNRGESSMVLRRRRSSTSDSPDRNGRVLRVRQRRMS